MNLAASMHPYLMRGLIEWCEDHGHTPHALVVVDDWCQVPREFVQDDQIVFNIGAEATQGLHIDDETMRFKARFGGKVHEVNVPLRRVAAIFARESGQGMTFDVSEAPDPSPEPLGDAPTQAARPALRRVK